MPKMTLKNTKQEILDALAEAEKKLKSQSSVMSVPGEAAEKARVEKVVASAQSDVADGIFSEDMIAKFENLQEAIQVLEAKLKSHYGVEKTLMDMTIALNAQKQAQLDAEAQTMAAKADAARVAEELRAGNKQLEADLRQAREREQEEYNYDLARRRKIAEDKFKDDMASLAKQTAVAQAALDALVADAAKITAMESRIENLPAELEAKYQEGVADGTKSAGKEYGIKTSLAEKDHQYELRERDASITRMKAELEEKSEKIKSLEEKLDTAYSQLRDLAAKTVESSGGVKIIGASDSGNGRK